MKYIRANQTKNKGAKISHLTHVNIGLVLLWILALNTSCNDSILPGPISQEVRSVGTFNGISIGYGFTAEITYDADVQEVIVEAPENFQQYIYTTVKNGIMTLSVDNGVNLKGFNNPKLFIKTPQLNFIGASGGSKCFSADDFSSTHFNFNLSGGSQSHMSIDCEEIGIQISGGSILNIEGSCNGINLLQASGGSQFYGFDFISQTGKIDASGGSQLEVNVSDQLTLTASGGCQIFYKGTPEITDNLSGGAKLIDKN